MLGWDYIPLEMEKDKQTVLVQLENDLGAPFKRFGGEGRQIQVDTV